MRETISYNDKSLSILNKLIINGFYSGNISLNRFEFERKKPSFLSVNNHRIIGILNSENKFELNFDFKSPMNITIKLGIGVGILFSLISVIQGHWFLPIPFFIVPTLIIFIDFKLKMKKEISLFTSKFLELYKMEYEY